MFLFLSSVCSFKPDIPVKAFCERKAGKFRQIKRVFKFFELTQLGVRSFQSDPINLI